MSPRRLLRVLHRWLKPAMEVGARITDVASASPDGGKAVTDARDGSTDGASPAVAGGPVNLRTAGNYVMLAKTGIFTVPTAAVTGNLGVSPAAATYITGPDCGRHRRSTVVEPAP